MGYAQRRLTGLAQTLLLLSTCLGGAANAHGQSDAGQPAASARTSNDGAATPRVVGYLPQWGLYYERPWLADDLVTSGAAPLLDQVNYAQANIRNARCVVADPNADLNYTYSAARSIDGKADLPTAPLRGGFHQVQLLKARYPRIHTLISLEGKPSTFAEAALPANREAFVASCIDMFVRGHLAPGIEAPGLFEGFDLDWEFPHDETEGANYMALVAEFRRQLDAAAASDPATDSGRKPLLSVAAGPGTRRYPGVDWSVIAKSVDEVGLMNYDYSGPWQQLTGMIAPLYPIDGGPPRQGTVDGTVAEYEAAGVPASKLLMGVPFYGYGWEKVAVGSHHGLFQAGQAVHGDSPYNRIATLLPKSTIYRDENSRTPWLFDGQAFWTFDDPVSAWTKAAYAASHHLAGVMIWELSGDTGDAQLLRAIHAGLGASTAPARTVAATPSAGRATANGAVSQ